MLEFTRREFSTCNPESRSVGQPSQGTELVPPSVLLDSDSPDITVISEHGDSEGRADSQALTDMSIISAYDYLLMMCLRHFPVSIIRSCGKQWLGYIEPEISPDLEGYSWKQICSVPKIREVDRLWCGWNLSILSRTWQLRFITRLRWL